MTTGQSGKRKLIPHAQKDGLFRLESNGSRVKKGRGQGRNAERRREQIEPDRVKGILLLSFSFALFLSRCHSIDDLQLHREAIESVFHGIVSIEETLEKTPAKINRLWRCVMKYACDGSWHSAANMYERGPWRSKEICTTTLTAYRDSLSSCTCCSGIKDARAK